MARKRNPPSSSQNGEWAGSVEEWTRRAGPHHVTLGSGMRVIFHVLGWQTLARLEGLPEELQHAVTLHAANLERGGLSFVIGQHMRKAEENDDQEAADKAMAYTRDMQELSVRVVAEALVAPKLTVEQLRDPKIVPEGDLEELMRLCTGRAAFDSRGVRIGVEPIESLARFRHHHNCSPDCQDCEETLNDLSSVDLGAV